MTAYYNEIEPYAAAWLERLIAAGEIAPGDVDRRDIRDVRPDDLRSYTQCHFFAGIGIWSLALRGAGWPDDRPVWTGSCPCQPFSASGARGGFADERHLWPHWHWLISQRRPRTVFGEQVASKDGLAWVDLVSADLEGTDYTGWINDLCSAGVGSPNMRQRLYFVAERMGDAFGAGLEGFSRHGDSTPGRPIQARSASPTGQPRRLADADLSDARAQRQQPGRKLVGPRGDPRDRDGDAGRPGPVNGLWRDADWLGCRDGKWRPVEPGTFPLAHGYPDRLGKIRAYGNAINAAVAQEFVEAYLDREIAIFDGDFRRDHHELV